MPVADTELLFRLSPTDPLHRKAISVARRLRPLIPDTALFEFDVVLRSRGRSPEEIRRAFQALSVIFDELSLSVCKTIDLEHIMLSARIEQSYRLSFFDSLIAASCLLVDGVIVSDDVDFDRVEGIRRIGISR